MICDEPLAEDLWHSARSCDDAAWMIRRIWAETERPSVRKSQLFAVACAKQVWHLLTDERLRHAVETGERYADGLASRAEAWAAANQVAALRQEAEPASTFSWLTNLAGIAAQPLDSRFGDWKAANSFRCIVLENQELPVRWVRDIFGNPFRPLPPRRGKRRWEEERNRWLGWNDRTVPRLAAAIYEERAFDRLPILADALQEAGCDNEDILSHCRSGGEHVRGCWVVDLLTGKS